MPYSSFINITSNSLLRSACIILLLLSSHSYAEDWTYTVRPGDTLWELCKTYTTVNNCWQRVGPYNSVEYPKSLRPGTKIRFPAAWLSHPPSPATITFIHGGARRTNEHSSNVETTPADTHSAAPGEKLEIEDTLPLNTGDKIEMGATVIVDANSRVGVVFASGASMTIEGEAIVTFDQLSIGNVGTMVDTKINLQKGTVQTLVPKRKKSVQFEVRTPSAVAAVRGTNFRVSSSNTEQSQTRNEVFTGSIEIINNTQASLLPKGYGLLAKKDAPLPEKVKLLPAPHIKTPKLADVTENQDDNKNIKPLKTPVKVSWRKLKEADQYKLQLIDITNKAITWSETQKSNKTTIHAVKSGCYELRISGIDAQEFQGMPAKKNLCLQTLLAAPKDIVHNNKTISWKKHPDAHSYQIVFSKTRDFKDTKTEETKNTEFTMSSTHKPYSYVKIHALDEAGTPGEPSSIFSTQTPHQKEKGLAFFLILAFMLIGI